MDDKKNKKEIILYGALLSLALLALVFIIKITCPDLLNIENRWLAYSIIPLIIALIYAGLIEKIKVGDAEIIMKIDQPIVSNPKIYDVIQRSKSISETDKNLSSFDQNIASSYHVLFFKKNRKLDDVSLIRDNLSFFQNINLLEVVDEEGKFISITKINRRELLERTERMESSDKIKKLLNRLLTENNDEDPRTTKTSITENESIINAFEKIIDSEKYLLAVTDENGYLKGVIYKQKMEKYFLDNVLRPLKYSKR